MSIPESFLSELKSRVQLSAIVGRVIKLSRAGREFSGLCPFHREKSPSFTVADDKGMFHCFGCSAHGDVIEFVSRIQNLDFREAVEQLAGQVGLQVPRDTPEVREEATRTASLYAVMESAAKWFEAQLDSAGGHIARDYLVGRGIDADTIARFRLGFAPGSGLRQALRISEEDFVSSGLGWRSEDGQVREFFRHRLVLTITDRRGRVIAFGGRAFGDEKPKYLNSATSPIFNKGSTLFGLSMAREGSARHGLAVAVEGYFDVIAMHQQGLDYAVAPLGTALTEAHLEELWRLSPAPVICLDADSAGRRAMARTVERAIPLMTVGRQLKFATLQGGKDPAELVQAGHAPALEESFAAAVSWSEALWQVLRDRYPGDAPEHIAMLERGLFAAASSVPDPLLRQRLLGDFLQRLEMFDPIPAEIYKGRSKKAAPEPATDWVASAWAAACDRAERMKVYDWLSTEGVDLAGLRAGLGGVGLARVKFVSGRYDRGAWSDAPRPGLWEFGDIGAVILPAWQGDAGGRLLDLIAWDPRSGKMGTLTGRTIVMGEHLVDEALGFEARGLAKPVRISATPLSWLRRMGAGEHTVLVVDWSRAWEILGAARELVTETVELGEEVEQRVRPPQVRLPQIMVEGT